MIGKFHLRMGPAVLVPAIISAIGTGVAIKQGEDQKKAVRRSETKANEEKAKARAEMDAAALKKKQEIEGRIASTKGGGEARYGGDGTILSPTTDTTSIFK